MSLKTRLKKLESITQPENIDRCIFITCAYPVDKIKPPVIGYQSGDIQVMRLENESDDDLAERVKVAALAKAQSNCNGDKVVFIFEILADY